MKRIAFSGVFDIANYGDHLFPFLFEEWMRAAGEACETELYSVLPGAQSLGTGREVFALDSLAKRHRERPYDALVVSGGALIHYRNLMQRLPGGEEPVPYPIPHTWIAPSLLGLQTGVPVLWNAPGVPADFEGAEKEITAFLLRGVDFLSTRNEASAASLRAVLPPERPVTVTPDPAFFLSRYRPDAELAGIRADLGLPARYAVFHTHPLLPERMRPDVVETLRALRAEGLEVILLPLAYTHGDELLAASLAERAQTEGIRALGRGLTLRQMLAVLAGCEMYIGVSFHGAITAFSYGRKVLALDFFRYRKTRAVYEIMGEERNYLTGSAGLREKALALLAEAPRDGRRLEELQTQVDLFYEAMLRALRNPPARGREPDAALTFALMRQAAIRPDVYSAEYVESLIRYRDSAGEALERLERNCRGLQARADALEQQRRAMEEDAKTRTEQFSEYVRQSEESTRQSQAYIRNLEERCRQLEEYGRRQEEYAGTKNGEAQALRQELERLRAEKAAQEAQETRSPFAKAFRNRHGGG